MIFFQSSFNNRSINLSSLTYFCIKEICNDNHIWRFFSYLLKEFDCSMHSTRFPLNIANMRQEIINSPQAILLELKLCWNGTIGFENFHSQPVFH